MNTEIFAQKIAEQGWVILDQFIDRETVDRVNEDMAKAYETCREIQVKNGVGGNTDGSVHHVLIFKGGFLDLLSRSIPMELITSYFDGKFILNSFGGIINLPNKPTYACNAHRDIRFFVKDTPLMLTMLIMLDDFTLENGATYVLGGSHLTPEKPSDEYFAKNADRAVGKAGSVLVFNSSLWHAAGHNQTHVIRRALTLTFTKPFMKPQFDYCGALGVEYVKTLSEDVKQLVGLYSRVPTSLDEWYQPPENRMYRVGQD